MDIFNHTVPAVFNNAFNQKGSKPYIVFGDHKITYGALKINIGKYSTFFRNSGIKAGDRVIFSSKNESFVCIFYLSLVANGITAVFIDPESGSDRANAIIGHCETKFIFVDPEIQLNWNLASTEGSVVTTIHSDVQEVWIQKIINKNRKENQLFPACVDELPETDFAHEIDPEADAYILFTSGTTSAPKGVRISYRALFNRLAALSSVYQLDKDSKLLNNLMLSHADGMMQGPFLILYNGATLYRPFPFSIQRIEDIFDVVYGENITHWHLVPTMIGLIYQFKQKDSDTLNGKHFKYVISCGSKLEAMLWQQFEEKFKTRIIVGYGLTETTIDCLFAGPDDDSHVIGSIGKPVGCEVKIMDDFQNEKAIGEQGEIWLRGSMLMSGYLNAPEASKDTFHDDWFKSGDIGYIGEDGCFRITGRKKFVIISGGINVSPEEVTEVLHTHPAVQDAVTFGLDDHIWGEIVSCAIVVKENQSIRQEDIVAYCRKRLEEGKVPKRVYFVDKLPYGRSGKVIISDIKKTVIANGDKSALTSQAKPTFLNIVSYCLQLPPDSVRMDMIAEDTPAWDSITHLILIAEMEKIFGIEFSPLEVMNINGLSDLYSLVETKIQP